MIRIPTGHSWQETGQEAGDTPVRKTGEANGSSPLPPSFPQTFEEHSEGYHGPAPDGKCRDQGLSGDREGNSPGSRRLAWFLRVGHQKTTWGMGVKGLPGHRAGPGAPGPHSALLGQQPHPEREGKPLPAAARDQGPRSPQADTCRLFSPGSTCRDLPRKAGAADPPRVTTESRGPARQTGQGQTRADGALSPTERTHYLWSPALQDAAWPGLDSSQVSTCRPSGSPVLTHLALGGPGGPGSEYKQSHGADGTGGGAYRVRPGWAPRPPQPGQVQGFPRVRSPSTERGLSAAGQTPPHVTQLLSGQICSSLQ